MKKLAMLVLAVAAAFLPADLASARGGRGGRGGGRGGGVGRGAGAGAGLGRGSGRGGGSSKSKNIALMRERALAENRDAILRDGREDSI